MAAFSPLPGSDRTLLPNSRPAGPVDLSETARITVRVRSKGDLDALHKRVAQLSTVPVATRQYLTLDQLEATYGADASDLDAIEHFAHRHNLSIVRRSAVARSVTLSGSLRDLLSAFHTNLQTYHHPLGTYRGRRGPLLVPSELDKIITGVFGFDTRPRHRSRRHRLATAAAGPGGRNGVAATEFAKRYKFPAGDGAGQTVAIIELGGGYRTSDLQAFFGEIGQPMPNIAAISVDQAQNTPGSDSDGEVMLDIEVVGAVVPKANLAVYFAPNQGDQGFIDAISAAVHDRERAPSVISISWGISEDALDKQGIQAYNELFTAAAALGITVCAASGDHGTANTTIDQWDGKVHVNHPACDPLVLSCGGTQIQGGTDVQSGTDVAWNDGTSLENGGWVTGGGISQAFKVPPYQKGIKMPKPLGGGKSGRGVPDIAMSATDYFVRVDSSEGPSGGTSAVAPLMAALVAKLNQGKGKRVGMIHQFLYSASGVFVDVTSGTNAIQGTAKGYAATTGWDACTGLGTPIGDQIYAKI